MIHPLAIDLRQLHALNVENWWKVNLTDLERIARVVTGNQSQSTHVRQGEAFALIANRKLGALAPKLNIELIALSTEAQKILATNKSDAVLRAAAAYHIRFENIHPLGEGNGRCGRLILAGQLYQSLGLPPRELLDALHAQEMDYIAAFVTDRPDPMFELLLDLLAQLTGQMVAPESNKVPFSLQPLHLDRRPVAKAIAHRNQILRR